nr:replication initiation protein [Microvirus sp.]
MTDAPWISCFKPIDVKDCFGNSQLVGCGKCPACQELKRNNLSNRLAAEEQNSKFCYFITLTYDEKHLPILDLSSLWSEPDDAIVTLLRNWDFDDTLGAEPRTIVNSNDVRDSLKHYNLQRDFYKCNYSVNVNATYEHNQVAILVNRHLQLFIKRLRKYIFQNYGETVRYYAIGEYGTNSLRPHWHLLLFFSSSELRRDFENTIQVGTSKRPAECALFLRSLWKYGICDSRSTDGKAYFYVSSYVNKSANFPYVLNVLAPQRAFHSNFLGEIYSQKTAKESLLKKEFENVGKVNVVSFDGTSYSYSVRRSLLARLLPRFSFAALTNDQTLFRILTMFSRPEVLSMYQRLGSVLNLAQHIFNSYMFDKRNEYHLLAQLLDVQCLACTHRDMRILSPLTSALYASKKFCDNAVRFGVSLEQYFDIYTSYYEWLDYSRLTDVLSKCELDKEYAKYYYMSIEDFDSLSTDSLFISYKGLMSAKFRSRIKHKEIADRYKFNF